ncbi:unnamed protein product [Closterium sp. NIES-53]
MHMPVSLGGYGRTDPLLKQALLSQCTSTASSITTSATTSSSRVSSSSASSSSASSSSTSSSSASSFSASSASASSSKMTHLVSAGVLLTWVLQRFDFQFSSPQPTPLSTSHSLLAPPWDESVEPSGPYPELVGCLMYLMTCTRPHLAYPLSLLACYVAPGRHRKRLSQGYTFSLGSGSVLLRSTRSSSVLGSSCEAEIYAGAMAAQELRWLTYLLTDLGEWPRSPPILYVDNKAMLALCHEQRLEHRTKHIALR